MRRSSGALAAALTLLLAASTAWSESAADKATAREAATEGIELYRAGKYTDALDRLRRAQALYDAPVHLLYIARSQGKLGQLVEAAENYRLLDHATLPSGAPEAWMTAVSDGRKELAELEPRVPKLRILAVPADVKGASLTIDRNGVSAAVIGISRPMNPGQHHVEIAAPGHATARADVDLPEGEAKDVTLTLVAGAQGAPVAAAVATSPGAERADQPSFFGFLLGLRLGLGVPTGTLAHAPSGDISAADAFKTGGGLELHGGVRLGRYFTPVLYVEGESLSPGAGILGGTKVTKTSASAVGIGLLVGTAPGRLGGFGEFDLAATNSTTLTQTTPIGSECTITATGGGFRLGGGGVFPVSTWLHVTPFAMATLGRFSSLTVTPGCAGAPAAGTIPSGDVRTHGMIFLGVGGDVILGNDRTSR
jgi:hypothetical protein